MFVKKLWIFRLKESKHFISGTALRKLHILSSWHHSKSSLDKIHKDLTKKKIPTDTVGIETSERCPVLKNKKNKMSVFQMRATVANLTISEN